MFMVSPYVQEGTLDMPYIINILEVQNLFVS